MAEKKSIMDQVRRGVVHTPPRLMLYGVHGIGKSTIAADAPNAIFIPTEDGADEIDVPKMPKVASTDEVLVQLRALYKEAHDFQTVVIDSADWLEDFIHLDLKASYTEKELSYGKDSVRAAEKMNEVLTALNHLREQRGMSCILIAHCEVKRFDSPMSEPYDRYQPKLQSRMGSLIQEWSDAVLFTTYDVAVKREEAGGFKEHRRGIATGLRKVFTEERPAFHAKNRYRMPVEIDIRENEPHPFAQIGKHIPYFAAQLAAE